MTKNIDMAYFIRFKKFEFVGLKINVVKPKYSQAIFFKNGVEFISSIDLLGCEAVILFTTKERITTILNSFDREKIIMEQTDITKKLFLNAPEDAYLKQLIERNKNNKLLHQFYLNRFTVDDVLDKIIELGIDQLTSLDYSILKKHNL